MQWLANLSVRRAVFASVLMLAIVVVGLAGYRTLGVDAFPKVDFPTVAITTRLDGAAPEEVETQITDKIEAAVNTISGIDDLRSISSEGVSQVYVTFQLEKSVDVAAQEVRDHVSTTLPDLPQGIDQPVVQKLDPDASPILYVAVSAPQPIREVTEVADKQIRRAIENIPGVGQVTLAAPMIEPTVPVFTVHERPPGPILVQQRKLGLGFARAEIDRRGQIGQRSPRGSLGFILVVVRRVQQRTVEATVEQRPPGLFQILPIVAEAAVFVLNLHRDDGTTAREL